MRSVKFNAVMNTLLTASNMLVSFLTIPYVTRVLSVKGYGDVTFAQSVSSWLSTICLMGVGTYGIRECARVRDDQPALVTTVRELLTIISVSTVVVLTGFAVAIFLVPRFAELSSLMWVFLVSTLLLSYGVEWYFQAIEQYEYITVRSVLFKLASLVLIFLLVRSPEDSLVYGIILALVSCGNNIFNILRLVRTLDWSLAGPLRLKRHLRPLASFAALSIASSVYLNLDSVILGLAATSYEVGLYQLAVKLKGVMWSVLNAVLGVMIPRLSNLAARDERSGFERLLSRGGMLTITVCFAFAGYLLVFAEPVAVFISGEAFRASAATIRVIGAVNLFSCLSYFVGLCVLTPLGRERDLALGNLAGVPVSLIFNLLLDGRFGSIGAAVSVLCAEIVIFLVQMIRARGLVARTFETSSVVKIAAANTAAVGVSLLFCWVAPGLSNMALVVVGTGIYLLVLLSALGIQHESSLVEFVSSMRSSYFGRRQ